MAQMRAQHSCSGLHKAVSRSRAYLVRCFVPSMTRHPQPTTGASMRRVILALLLSSLAFAQTSTSTTTKTTTKKTTSSTAVKSTGPATPASKDLRAVFHTSEGDIHCVLFPDKAPLTVENFV